MRSEAQAPSQSSVTVAPVAVLVAVNSSAVLFVVLTVLDLVEQGRQEVQDPVVDVNRRA